MRASSLIERNTKETQIQASINLDGEGKADVKTDIGFFYHMLNTFAKHGRLDLFADIKGDTYVDCHHTVEDTGIVLGTAFKDALKSKDGIARYANFAMPMDDALVMCAIDICGRAYYASNVKFNVEKCGDFETETVDEFFRSFAEAAQINLHFVYFRGENAHHLIEAMFKAFAKCIHDATRVLPDLKGSLTTKGVL